MFCLASPIHPRIHKKKSGAKSGAGLDATAPANITYHGGPVINKPVLYLIWYGSWTGNNATTIVTNFVKYYGQSPWWTLNRGYNNTSPITYGKSTTDNYSQGTNLTNTAIYNIVIRAITMGRLPNNVNGVYLVLTSSDCNQTSFCTSACAWHTSYGTLKYGWVGNPEVLCPYACSIQSISPNGNLGADAMISLIAHESAETVSDPNISAWYDANGDENADKCIWTYGTTYTVSNGALANMKINGYNYLVQQLWKLPTQSCALS